MRALAGVLLALIVGLGIGAGSAWFAVDRVAISGEVIVGQWRGNLHAGSAAADPYTRAAIAKTGLLALARSETIYFFRKTDEDGALLDPACTYRLEGGDLPSWWWSITLYDEQLYLARNQDGAASIDATRAAREADGRYQGVIGPVRGDSKNWLSTNAAAAVNLTIRLYNPSADVQAQPATVTLPTVVKVSCPQGTSS